MIYKLILLATFALAHGEPVADDTASARLRVRVVGPSIPALAPSPSGSSRSSAPTAYRLPHVASGPPTLLSLAGRCFSTTQTTAGRSYEFTICPFENVTQREASSAWNSFFGILGIWNDWEKPEATHLGEIRGSFTDGTDCGGKRRQAMVTLACSGPAGLRIIKAISEPRTCEYELTLACPEACDIDVTSIVPNSGIIAAESEAQKNNGSDAASGSLVAAVDTAVAAILLPSPTTTFAATSAATSATSTTTTVEDIASSRLELFSELKSEIERLDKGLKRVSAMIDLANARTNTNSNDAAAAATITTPSGDSVQNVNLVLPQVVESQILVPPQVVESHEIELKMQSAASVAAVIEPASAVRDGPAIDLSLVNHPSVRAK
jgi:hypothetical protein